MRYLKRLEGIDFIACLVTAFNCFGLWVSLTIGYSLIVQIITLAVHIFCIGATIAICATYHRSVLKRRLEEWGKLIGANDA